MSSGSVQKQERVDSWMVKLVMKNVDNEIQGAFACDY